MIHEGKGEGQEDKVRGEGKGMTGIWKVSYAEGNVREEMAKRRVLGIFSKTIKVVF